MTKTNNAFLDLFAVSSVVTKAWRTNEVIDEVTFQYWGDEDLVNFALDYDKVDALQTDDVDALIFTLAKRLEKKLG